MNSNYYFKCYRLQEEKAVVLEGNGVGLKAAVQFFERNFCGKENFQWAHLGFVNPPIDKDELVLTKDSLPIYVEKLEVADRECFINVSDSGKCIGLQCSTTGFLYLTEVMSNLVKSERTNNSFCVEQKFLSEHSLVLKICMAVDAEFLDGENNL